MTPLYLLIRYVFEHLKNNSIFRSDFEIPPRVFGEPGIGDVDGVSKHVELSVGLVAL